MESYFFTEDHQLFRQSFRDFLEKEVRPHIDEWEANRETPRHIYKRFGEMGFLGLPYPEVYGGSDLDVFYSVIYTEEMTRMNSGGFCTSIGAHSGLALAHINGEGNEAQKQKYLTAGLKGELIGCLAITEPGGGSDVASLRTTAKKEGDHYIINGSKTFISNGVLSDYIVAAVRTGEPGAKGISMMIIDRDTPGVSATKLEKLGWHASDTGEIAFDDVRVPVESLLGEENRGFFYIMQHFASERLAMALIGVSQAELAIDLALEYMAEREAFGRSINKFQALRHRIAQMSSEVMSTRVLVYSLYRRFGDGDYIIKEAAMAKLLGTQLSDRVCYECMRMFGGYGYMESYPMARLLRDSQLGTIGGGTSEVLCEIISKMIIDSKNYKAAV
ncbi:MAG: acyl-CoA dehydrogenase family protein [Bacteroidia bacterium]|nr:acyl-CoA dehydrogenase family protein [Bacteroidia bacterium]